VGDDLLLAAHLGPTEIAEAMELLAEVASATGHEAMSEDKRLQLQRGDGDDFCALLLRDPSGELAAYGQLGRHATTWAVEVAVRHQRRRDGDPSARLLAAAVEMVAANGGGRLRYWVPKARPDDDRRSAALGFAAERDLLQLRVTLPLEKGVRLTPPLAVRAFVPGKDEERWLRQNNRAFADHPEQGGWTLADLERRTTEPWFDPAGFLLYEEGGRLAGSCWTKVHADADPPMGEIYAISVDPDFHRRGLGRGLTVAGLDHLAASGLKVGMLYVDGDNTAGTSLYLSLGFSPDHVDRAYTIDVAASGS
jgi:mycothiol synthase